MTRPRRPDNQVVVAVPCPFCEVVAGEWCITWPWRERANQLHRQRRRAAALSTPVASR